jgi:hypothetical protein
MARIIISTHDGEVVKIIDNDDIGNVNKLMGLADLADTIRVAVNEAQRRDRIRWAMTTAD